MAYSKLFWNIRNEYLRRKFYTLQYLNLLPSIEESESEIKKDWRIIYGTYFMTWRGWTVKKRSNWGSIGDAPHAHWDSIHSEDNVFYNGEALQITCSWSPTLKLGKGWEGKDVYSHFESGHIEDSHAVAPRGRFSAVMRVNGKNIGSWPAFWLFCKNTGDDNYSEVDGFEMIAKKKMNSLLFSVHYGEKTDRKIYNWSVKVKAIERNEKFRCCIVFEEGLTKIYINNRQVFETDLGYPKAEYRMTTIFSDSINSFDGKVDLEKVRKKLPYKFEIFNFIHAIKK